MFSNNTYNMTALHKPIATTHDQVKYTIAQPRLRLQPLNHRNYNSSKQLTSNLDLSSTKQIYEPSRLLDHFLPSIEKADHKNQELHRLKLVNQRERYEIIRKNASLKLLRREEGVKAYNRSKGDEIRNIQTLAVTRQDKVSIQAQSQNSIPLKRALVKRSHNYLRIGKRNDQEREPQKSDVSFEDGLEKLHAEEEKVVPPAIICSENLLGNGMRKFSSAKMKALVINPFERVMRHQQEVKEVQSHQIPPLQAENFKESQILEKGDDNCPSTTQQQEIQELLGMMDE